MNYKFSFSLLTDPNFSKIYGCSAKFVFGSPVTVTSTGTSRVLAVGSLVLKATMAFLFPARSLSCVNCEGKICCLAYFDCSLCGCLASHLDPVAQLLLVSLGVPQHIFPLNASIGSTVFIKIFFIS